MVKRRTYHENDYIPLNVSNEQMGNRYMGLLSSLKVPLTNNLNIDGFVIGNTNASERVKKEGLKEFVKYPITCKRIVDNLKKEVSGK